MNKTMAVFSALIIIASPIHAETKSVDCDGTTITTLDSPGERGDRTDQAPFHARVSFDEATANLADAPIGTPRTFTATKHDDDAFTYATAEGAFLVLYRKTGRFTLGKMEIGTEYGRPFSKTTMTDGTCKPVTESRVFD